MVSNYDFSPKMNKFSLKVSKKILIFLTKKSLFSHQKVSFSERFQLKNKHFSKNCLPAALVFALLQVSFNKNIFKPIGAKKTTKLIFENFLKKRKKT
jgi:hypothetical protein